MKTNYPSKPEPGFNFVNGTIMMAKIDSIRTAAPFKTLFPIREDVLNRIVTDMEQHGFDSGHPIVVWSGKKLTVVDGHTRLLAAQPKVIDMRRLLPTFPLLYSASISFIVKGAS